MRTSRGVLLLALLELIAACQTAGDRAADAEYSRAIQDMADRRVEYGELRELNDVQSICFLASVGSDVLAEFTRAVSEHRPERISVAYGTITRDCPASEIFVSYDAGRGVVFSVRDGKMRILAEKRTKSALVFAREFLTIMSGEKP
jgi:hypothetical protein